MVVAHIELVHCDSYGYEFKGFHAIFSIRRKFKGVFAKVAIVKPRAKGSLWHLDSRILKIISIGNVS